MLFSLGPGLLSNRHSNLFEQGILTILTSLSSSISERTRYGSVLFKHGSLTISGLNAGSGGGHLRFLLRVTGGFDILDGSSHGGTGATGS